MLAQKRLAESDMAGAISEIKNMDLAARGPYMYRDVLAEYMAWHVMFAIRQGDLETALNWGRRLSECIDIPFSQRHVPARLLIAQGDKRSAAEQLRGLYEKAVLADAQGLMIAIRVCQALAADTPAKALTFLAEALIKGEPEGFIRTFVDEGRLLAPLLHKALSQGVTPEYTGKLLGIIEAEEHCRMSRMLEVNLSAKLPEQLSERELEVLRLLAEDASNQQIASRLTISLSTVKTHVHHILDKLNTKNRTLAIERARQLKLI
jgi:LuxR family maltose regulon positive regulatory protein